MKTLSYTLVDVFTDIPFGGNQLAVVEGRTDLSTETMQKIARELNLSETVFIYPPHKSTNTRKLRIFTPQMELPMAGHPTIGAAYVLASNGLVPTTDGWNEFVFEEEVGEIRVAVLKEQGRVVKVEMKQPMPSFDESFGNRELAADLLSLTDADLVSDLPIQMVSSGVPFLFVPIRSLEAIRRIQFRLDVWEQHFKGQPNYQHIFAFSSETENKESSVHGRMFAPAMGISEDPATGAASGPMGAYLVKHRVLPIAENGIYTITSEQGFEMGRPSFINITINGTAEDIEEVKIGGNSVTIGKGELFI